MRKQRLKILTLILVLLLGVALRVWKYPFYPLAGNAEEYAYVWQGLSIIEEGVPVSWSMLPPYGKENIVWQGEAHDSEGGGGLGVQLVKPWFDQTPLFSLIVGIIAKLYHQPNFTLISSYIIRIPSLVFSFLAMIFLFILARKYFGFWTGILSLLIYSTTPTIVFGSRLVVPENMIVLLVLICLWLILLYLETAKKWQRNLSFFLAIIAGFAKATGILIVPFLVFWLWRQKKWKEGFFAGLISLVLFCVPYFLYGAYYDKDLFFKIFLYQASRPAGWSSFAYLITNPGFSIEVFLDGFLIIGFLSLVFLLFKKRSWQEEMILISFVFSILVVIITGGRHDQLAWYRYPIYPFMAISLAIMIKEVWLNPNIWVTVVFIPFLLSNLDLLENPFWEIRFFMESSFYRFAFWVLLLPSFIFGIFSSKKIWLKLSRFVVVFVFLIGVIINIWVIQSRFNLLCDNTTCPLPQKVDLLKWNP